MVLRAPGQSSVHIVVNAPGERLRFRYLHMLPQQLDRNEVIHGHVVREGEVIGQVGNYLRRENATTYHLHFDIQVPTRYGWVFVNPYMTLVSAYERLIGGRGQEVKDPPNDEIKDEIKAVGTIPVAAPPLSPEVTGAVVNPVQSGVQSEASERIATEKTRDETTEPR
jgi:murein DD-endopeptidase MepM/ murein hydrolase activator NlpD